MSLFDVAQERGTWTLIRFAIALNLFLLLHLARLPFVLAARVLEATLRRLDQIATRLATHVPAKPVNQFFADPPKSHEEVSHVYA